MKKCNRIVAIILAVVIAVSLAACSSKSSGNGDTNVKEPTVNNADIASKASVGDSVTLGKFDNKDITWTVVSKEDGKLFLVSDKALVNMNFGELGSASWEDCSVRQWLSGTFYNDSFTDDEKAIITDTEIKDEATIGKGGTSVIDKVFVCSIEEIKNRTLETSSNYSEAFNAKCSDMTGTATEYWCRSIALDSQSVINYVDTEGEWQAYYNEEAGSIANYGVRPAMWITAAE